MNNLSMLTPLILMIVLYGLGIVALIYFIKALRIYIKKNS